MLPQAVDHHLKEVRFTLISNIIQLRTRFQQWLTEIQDLLQDFFIPLYLTTTDEVYQNCFLRDHDKWK